MNQAESHRESCLLRARLAGFARLLGRTEAIIREAFSQSARPYVALSGGKDSTVLLSLVREERPDTAAIFSDDEWNFPETMAYLDTVPNLTRAASRVRHASWFTSWESGPVGLPADTIWLDAKQGDGIPSFARGRGFDLAFIGLRKEEATYRRLHLCGRGTIFYCHTHQAIECNPLADWKVEDIWAYLLSREIRYNAAYDRMTGLNVPLPEQRVGPFAVEKAVGQGSLAIIKRGWPELWNQFTERYPEASNYA
jgi:3'-phosphoadenosine 5'-phosphosulfate sulfotransferase (PAPS reductase)/FAD synthetase